MVRIDRREYQSLREDYGSHYDQAAAALNRGDMEAYNAEVKAMDAIKPRLLAMRAAIEREDAGVDLFEVAPRPEDHDEKPLTRADRMRMSAAEIVAAHDAGKLDHLLHKKEEC